jgi:hypothetical protein
MRFNNEDYFDDKETRKRFEAQFLANSGGRWILGRILNGPCRFFGMCDSEETRIRQNVGRELLYMCGLLDEKTRPEAIIAKLTRSPGPETMTIRQFIKMKLRRKRKWAKQQSQTRRPVQSQNG